MRVATPDPSGWRPRTRVAFAAAAGLLLSTAFPPVDQGWVALFALVPLLLAVRGARGRVGALAGLAAGIGFFGPLILWISLFGYLAWTVLVLAQAAFLAAFGALAARASAVGPWARLAGVPALWAAIEIARGRLPLGGFTWGSLAYAEHGAPVLPLARAGGMYLVAFAVLAVNALLAEAIVSLAARRRIVALAGAAAVALAPAVLPTRLAGDAAGTVDVAAAQGNVPRDRFSGLGRSGRVGPEDLTIVRNHQIVSEALVGDAPDLIVWPENAFDRDPRVHPGLFDPVVEQLGRIGAPLLVGAILDAGDRFRNSTLLVTPDGSLPQRYDKVHLVPFGEYVPWSWARRVVPALDRELPTDGIPGEDPHVFDVAGARVGTLICFESSYPELANRLVDRGAQLLVVQTNNASFGTSPASRQHLAMSRVRAVEHGRAVVHAAISGISAIVHPDGRVEQRTGLFEPALLRARLPLAGAQTPYARYGAWIEWGLIGGAVAAAAVGIRRRGELLASPGEEA